MTPSELSTEQYHHPSADTSQCKSSLHGRPSRRSLSTLVSRNVTIKKHRTSVRLEPEMWGGLEEICQRERLLLHEICTSVAGQKHANTSLTAALRVFVMDYFRAACTEDGHSKAGHGLGSGPGLGPQKKDAPSALAERHDAQASLQGKRGS